MRVTAPLLVLLLLPASALAQTAATAVAAGVSDGTVRVCATVVGRLRDFTATVDPATGDTMVGGRRFREAYPARYAADARWYHEGEQLPLSNWTAYFPYGLPRTLSSDDLREPGLELAQTADGIEVFAEVPYHEPRMPANPRGTLRGCDCVVLYVPVDAGCNFQPYQNRQDFAGVRG